MPRFAFKKNKIPQPDSPEESEDESVDHSIVDGRSDSDHSEEGEAEDDEDEDEDEDADAPRVVQWVDDDDEFDADAASSREEEEEDSDAQSGPVAGPSKLSALQDDLSSLPLGALLSAQRALKQAQAIDSDSEDSDSGPEEQTPKLSNKGKEKEKAKPEWSTKPRTDIAKRSSKHAPIEVTSKRPVTRKRTVVEVKTQEARDPRFLALAGEFSAEKFHKNYGFLANTHKSELATLRENLKAARKLLANSPRDLRAAREAEVARLEKAVKRTESVVNHDRRVEIDQQALAKLKDAETAKRKEGKQSWWMKDAEKKQLLAKARYDALAERGGNRAVKKAIEKKQKKIAQKEKKSRPFSKDGGLKRKTYDRDDGPPRKKPRA